MDKDKLFLDELLSNEEISEEVMDYIQSRWHDQSFREYYHNRLKEAYKNESLLAKYLPMIVFFILIIIGIILLK